MGNVNGWVEYKELEKTNWKEITDVEFIKYILKIRDKITLLKAHEEEFNEWIDKLNNINNSDKIDIKEKKSINHSLNLLNKLVVCKDLNKLLEDSDLVSIQNRKDMYNELLSINSILSSYWGPKSKIFIDNWTTYKKKSELTNDYFNRLKIFFNNINDKYDQRKNDFEFFNDLLLNSKIDYDFLKKSINDLKEMYYCSLSFNPELKTSHEFNFNDIENFENILSEYYKHMQNLKKLNNKTHLNALIKNELTKNNNDIDITIKSIIENDIGSEIKKAEKEDSNVKNDEPLTEEKIKDLYHICLVLDKYDMYNDSKRFMHEIVLGDNSLRDYFINSKYIELYKKNNKSPRIPMFKYVNTNYLDEEQKQKLDEFVKNYQKYFNSKKEDIIKEKTERTKKLENIALNIIIKYLDEKPNTNKEFCEKNKIDINDFEKVINIIKETNPELYDAYYSFITTKRNERYFKLISFLEYVLNNLMSTDPKKVQLEYYRTCDKISINTFYRLLRGKLEPKKQRFLAIFYQKFGNAEVLNAYTIKKYTDEYKIKYPLKNDKGEEVMYELTKEDKQQVFLMLQQENIPITAGTFIAMLKEYMPSQTEKENNHIK